MQAAISLRTEAGTSRRRSLDSYCVL